MPDPYETFRAQTERQGQMPEGIYGQVINVSPELAKRWLEDHNDRNRKLARNRVDQYARDMRDGEWTFDGSPINFNPEGQLLNGQHRLHAIVQSHTTQPIQVFFNVPTESQANMDTGMPRRLSDYYTMEGVPNSGPLVTVARRVVGWENGYKANPQNYRPTNHQVQEAIETYPELHEYAKVAATRAKKSGLSVAVLGLAMFLIMPIDFEQANWFFERVYDGAGLHDQDPIYLLRERMRVMPYKMKRRPESEQLGYTIVAWNHYRKDHTLGKLQAPRGGFTNENFPLPK